MSKLPIVQPWLPLLELPPAKRLGKYQLKPTKMELKASYYRIGLDLRAVIAESLNVKEKMDMQSNLFIVTKERVEKGLPFTEAAEHAPIRQLVASAKRDLKEFEAYHARKLQTYTEVFEAMKKNHSTPRHKSGNHCRPWLGGL